MNESQLRYRFPRASSDFVRSNAEANRSLPAAKPQRDKKKPLGQAVPREKESLGRVTVRFRRCCVRLLDWDNLAGSFKDICDGLWRCGAINGDSPDQIITICEQQKVGSYKQERLEIEIIYP